MLAGSIASLLSRSLPLFPTFLGGKCSCAYSSLHTNVYATWIHYFGKYIYNLDFEYETRGFFKLVYSYIQAFDSSWMTWNRATLSSEFATLPCNKLYTLVYLLSEWSFSVITIHDKYHRQFLFRFYACLQCHFANSILFATFLHKLGRVATFGDPQGIWL